MTRKNLRYFLLQFIDVSDLLPCMHLDFIPNISTESNTSHVIREKPPEDLIYESTISLSSHFQALSGAICLPPDRKKVKRMTLQTENP